MQPQHSNPNKQQNNQNQPSSPNQFQPNWNQPSPREIRTFLTWEAPGRPFKKRSRDYFVNGFLIMAAIEIILFLFSQYLLMAVVFSLVFLSFALSSVPPHKFSYKISTEGIQIEKTFFIWDELYDFYLFKHLGEDTVHVTTKSFFPGELTLTLGDLPADKVKNILLQFLPFREYVEPTFVQKAGDWLERNFPLERSAR